MKAGLRHMAGAALAAVGLGIAAWWLFAGNTAPPPAAAALAAALALAGTGSLFGSSMWWGAALLLAYGLGHSVLLLLAGALPAAAGAMIRRIESWQPWLPGRRLFAALLAATGLWWIAQGSGMVA
jgi:cytochrome c-type biogenesis protein